MFHLIAMDTLVNIRCGRFRIAMGVVPTSMEAPSFYSGPVHDLWLMTEKK